MRLILFDIDGTLAEGAHVTHMASMGRAVEEVFGVHDAYDPIAGAIRRTASLASGRVDSELIRLGAESAGTPSDVVTAGLETAISLMVDEYESRVANGADPGRLIPGIEATLDSIDVDGTTLGLLTGNARGIARVKLVALGIWHHFDVGGFGDMAEARADLLPIALDAAEVETGLQVTVRDTLYFGDTPRDVAAAEPLGVPMIGVATGSYSADDLLEAGACDAVAQITPAVVEDAFASRS